MQSCRFKATWKGVEGGDWWVQVADPGNAALPEQQLDTWRAALKSHAMGQLSQ